MADRNIIPWVVVPFVGLCVLAFWLTREEVASPPPEARQPAPQSAPPVREPPPAPSRPSAPPRAESSPERQPEGPPAPAPSAARPSPAPTQEAMPEPEALPSPRPALREPETGRELRTLDKEDIRRAIQSIKPLIRECFMDVAARYPGPQTVKLRFTIVASGTSGRFQDGEIAESTVQDPFVLACFLESLTDVQFPAPRGEGVVTVTYPFHFEPAPDAGP